MQASALDHLLRLAVDEASDFKDDPTYLGRLLDPGTSELLQRAEHVLLARQLLRDAFAPLLHVHAHTDKPTKLNQATKDSPKRPNQTAASKLFKECRANALKLQKHQGLAAGDEEVTAARLAEAVLGDDVEVVRALLELLEVVGPGYASAPPEPPAAKTGAASRDKGKSFMEIALEGQGSGSGAVEADAGLQSDDPQATDTEASTGASLMHYAALHGSVKVALFLCARYDASLLTAPDVLMRGRTPLHVASMRGRVAFLKATLPLVLRGVSEYRSLHAASPEHATATLLGVRDGAGATCLHYACEHGRPLTAEWLLSMGASLECEDLSLRTPAECAREHGHLGLAADLALLKGALK